MSNSSAQTGQLPAGKYFVQALGLGANTAYLKTAKFESGGTVTAVAPGAASGFDIVDEFPLASSASDGVSSFTLHVKPGLNDRIAAIMSAGTATLWLTQTDD
jgi:hypothetical protein